eukprot:SAG31_NODE_4867_length_2899_cov_1.889643_3_plen_204_part_00
MQDFTLQNGDSWFYSKTSGVHSPTQLRNMYEQSSGSNTGLIIDIAPFPNGSVPAPQVVAAQALGKYVKGCYGKPIATGNGSASTITIQVGGASVDRVQIREDQSQGQRVHAFKLTATPAGSDAVVSVPLQCHSCSRFGCNGVRTTLSSIGNKFICILNKPQKMASITLEVTKSDGRPVVSELSAFGGCGALGNAIDLEWAAVA